MTDGERKTVTALFADIKGSMELMEDLDPEDARAIVDPALKLMIDAAHRYDGYIVQSTGDGIFALFGAPVAHEDHPQRTLYAALRLQEELKRYSDGLRVQGKQPLQARVGVNTGEVVVRSIRTEGGHAEYTPIGHSTGLAARMQALAPIGSIAATQQTQKLCEGYFTFRPLGPTTVKGVSESVNVFEVTGLGPLRTRLQMAAQRGLTRFVGRQAELEQMKHALELVTEGHGQIVAAMGEPGVGKSRLFFEFKAVTQTGCLVQEAYSVSHGKASAYLPVIELLRGYFRVGLEDDPRQRREKAIGKVLGLDRSLEDTLPYVFALLGIQEGEDPLAQMDAHIRRLRTLEAVKRILVRESLNQPLMVIFEDLHWIDEESQALLNLLADSIANARILLLVNYRPEYHHEWGSRTHYTQLRLDPLGKESAEEMLGALVGDTRELTPLKRLIIERTEGVPFFMEETVQALFEDGTLARNGGVRLTRSLDNLRIPATVQAVLASRIDRLPAPEKALLQTLAVLGRDFTLGLVRCVTRGRTDELERILWRLQTGEFIYEQPATGDVEYIFKHALTQEVAYGALLADRRKLLHERAGAALEAMFANQLDDHLTELARHYSRSDNAGKALHYLTLAGKQSLERAAFAESQTLLQNGLQLVDTMTESPERDTSEFELASALVQVLMRTKGFAAPEFVGAASRARSLAEKRGNLAELVLQLSVIRLGALLSGDYSTSAVLADQILDLAQRDGSQASLELAHATQLQEHYNRGDLAGVEQDFARWGKAAGSRHFPNWVVPTIAAASHNAWLLGHADSARERIARAIAFASDDKHPYELALGRYFEGSLYLLLREPQRAEIASGQGLALSEEHGFTLYRDRARIVLGWAKAHLGTASEGVSLIRQGLAGYAEVGGKMEITRFLMHLAEAQALDGALDDALATIENAVRAGTQLVWVPDALTCCGELRLKIGQAELAEADFRRAIELAQKMNAKAWELRAATSLARLLREQGKIEEARKILEQIFGWFTEGFDTADLKDAKALLEELE
jgi:class 3 adenylate cyclase/tetratricopeptide (TPR) repeat protein